jgi:hypothetical protein
MKTTIVRSLSFTALIFSVLVFSVGAQVSQSNNQTVTPEVQKAQEAVNKVLEDSGRYFRDGLQAFKENRRSDAGQNFDKSVEVFLYSTLNIQRDGKLSGCYNQLSKPFIASSSRRMLNSQRSVSCRQPAVGLGTQTISSLQTKLSLLRNQPKAVRKILQSRLPRMAERRRHLLRRSDLTNSSSSRPARRSGKARTDA